MTDGGRGQGWDARAIHRIAEAHYGGLNGLFEAHGWPERGQAMMPAVGARIAETYGGVAEFERRHPGQPLPDPVDVIERPEPDVWLTSFYGFTPESWGYLGFTTSGLRDRFTRESRRGALIAIYGVGGATVNERGRLLGLLQMSRTIGTAKQFMTPQEWEAKQADPDKRDKWNFGIQAARAWRITPESRPLIQDFAPKSYYPDRARAIGAQCVRLRPDEAKAILSLDLEEVSVFGGIPVDHSVAGPASIALRPSRAGPVSQSAYLVREAEGPKHLYILRLNGNADHFMGHAVDGRWIIKVGMSCSPATRCVDHNRSLPACAFSWAVERSTFEEGMAPFASSKPALAGEKAMKNWLERYGESLGGEFFLVDPDQIERAWRRGVDAAENWTE